MLCDGQPVVSVVLSVRACDYVEVCGLIFGVISDSLLYNAPGLLVGPGVLWRNVGYIE